jgi:hypothetical protein
VATKAVDIQAEAAIKKNDADESTIVQSSSSGNSSSSSSSNSNNEFWDDAMESLQQYLDNPGQHFARHDAGWTAWFLVTTKSTRSIGRLGAAFESDSSSSCT